MTLPEDLLHFIWKYRLYQTQKPVTVSGKPLAILYTGMHNNHAGPDFRSAKIRIGTTEWAGNVEIHWRSSDWNTHRHDHDLAYNNVILHVVYEHDKDVRRIDGTTPEVLELKPLISEFMLQRYQQMMNGMSWIPCERHIDVISPLTISQWLSRLLIERFEHRVNDVLDLLEQQQGNWDETCYLWMARCFGFSINAPAFEQLARSVPQAILTKYQQRSLALEAIFFGQAGMLEGTGPVDEYTAALRNEYAYRQKLHVLSPPPGLPWRFMRTRPGNFPSMRIAQFVAFYARSPYSFATIRDAPTSVELKAMFQQLPVHEYWRRHYRIGKRSATHSNQLGERSIQTLLINAVAVILFAFGKYINEETYIYRAVSLLETLKPEDNAIIRRFSTFGIHARQAAESQALLQMKAFYCDRKKCLDCSIGLAVIKNT